MKKSILWILLVAMMATQVFAHCDTLDGPVITDARTALETKNINHVLVWVQPEDEKELRKAFEKALVDNDDTAFFEALVRIHREGEGAEYTGIKPAGQVEPVVQLADKALAAGQPGILVDPITQHIRDGLTQRYNEVAERQDYAVDDVAAGREYVKHYVGFMHYAEGIANAAHASGHDHGEVHQESHADFVPAVGWAIAGVLGIVLLVLVAKR